MAKISATASVPSFLARYLANRYHLPLIKRVSWGLRPLERNIALFYFRLRRID